MVRTGGGEHLRQLGRYANICLAVFTAFTGAALGVVENLFAGVRGTLDFTIRLWVTVGLAVIAGVALVGYGWLSKRRSFLLSQRGTSYVVDSPAETWTPDDKNAYMIEGANAVRGCPRGCGSDWTLVVAVATHRRRRPLEQCS
ncbi:hypothetical protein [Microlunatus phosphovorus]|uniref:hypothetical protein n=1 Tax=Microlunatus phosphovorus TaxID=29405 RepID=UPI0005A0CF81|nr:hypothetical protein [Microlunatus phosphovorus]